MASAYPGGLDSFATNKTNATATPNDHPAHHNDLADAVNKVEAELGVTPSGAAATVAARFTALDAAVAAASVPAFLMYPFARVAGETAHASDDFFSSVTGYTETDVTGTTTWSGGRGGLSCIYAGQSNNDFSTLLKAVPAAGLPTTIETKISLATKEAANPMAGLLFTNGTASTSALAGFGLVADAAGVFQLYNFSGTLTSVTANVMTDSLVTAAIGQVFMRFTAEAANVFSWSVSPDTRNWTDFAAADLTPTLTPTHMGFFVSAWGASGDQVALFNYLRVYDANLGV